MQPLAQRPDAGQVLAQALRRAADTLDLSQSRLAAVLGVSPASVSRLGRGREVDPSTKEGELGLLFLRVFRSLDTLVGGDGAAARQWLWAPNHHLSGTPGEMVETVTGLAHVADYLDAMRS